MFQSLGRTDEWQHTLDAAVTSITLCDHQTVHDTLRDMHDNGYLGWSGQQRLLSQGVDDGFDAGNLDAPGQQEDVFLEVPLGRESCLPSLPVKSCGVMEPGTLTVRTRRRSRLAY